MSPLDNPIWHSLTSRHSTFAIGEGLVRRYPVDVAPFAGCVEPSEEAAEELTSMVEQGEKVGLLGVMSPLAEGWVLIKDLLLHQYTWSAEHAAGDPEAVQLGEEHVPAMLELTALVYPAYFRRGTAKLGDYFGLFDGDRLAAMAGIRMAMDGFCEVSAICTHPEYRGRGLASRLTLHTVHFIEALGDRAFLHTESDNPAQAMYEKLGFELHQVIPFQVYERTPTGG